MCGSWVQPLPASTARRLGQQQLHVGGDGLRAAAKGVVHAHAARGVEQEFAGRVVDGVAAGGAALDALVVHPKRTRQRFAPLQPPCCSLPSPSGTGPSA